MLTAAASVSPTRLKKLKSVNFYSFDVSVLSPFFVVLHRIANLLLLAFSIPMACSSHIWNFANVSLLVDRAHGPKVKLRPHHERANRIIIFRCFLRRVHMGYSEKACAQSRIVQIVQMLGRYAGDPQCYPV